jgi:regulator of sirC expression with transglutaminase-like and TPR domain
MKFQQLKRKKSAKYLACSLDNVFQLRHPCSEKMKTFSIFRRESRSHTENQDSQIRVYRSHAARAISEERWEVAEIFIDRILNVDPHHTEAWLMKGHLRHHCREDEQTAVDCYRKVINLCGPESGHPHAQRARTSLGRLLSVWS